MKLKLIITDTNSRFLKKIAVFKFNINENMDLFEKLIELEFYNEVKIKNLFSSLEDSDFIFELVQDKKYSFFKRTKRISHIRLFEEQIDEELVRLLPNWIIEKLNISKKSKDKLSAKNINEQKPNIPQEHNDDPIDFSLFEHERIKIVLTYFDSTYPLISERLKEECVYYEE